MFGGSDRGSLLRGGYRRMVIVCIVRLSDVIIWIKNYRK